MDLPVEKSRMELAGESISPGVAIAHALLFKQISLDALEMISFPVDDPAKEIDRLNMAIRKSRDQLSQIYERVTDRQNSEISDIFKVQMQLLEDPTFLQELKNLVKAQLMNVEHVLASQMRVLENRFALIRDEVIRSKFLDVQDVYHRILRNLLEIEHVRTNPMQRIDEPVIFVSEKLVPSDVALLDFKKIQGIIIEEGSRMSHVAVISKSLGIPAIIKASGAGTLIRSGDLVIVDGYTGKVVVNPSGNELPVYREKREHFLSGTSKKLTNARKHCETQDGRKIRLEANIGSIKEAEAAMAYGADGIGLLRSELFYMSCAHSPSIEEEIEFYRTIIGITRRRPITIRLLDIGADKSLPFLKTYEEENPQLGIRGVRYLLKYPDLFRRHLIAVLSVCRLTHIKIALPFVATIEDWEQARMHIRAVCCDLRLNEDVINIGIMAEIPSVALSMRTFIPKVGFVNIGTNDLVQYIFAASREDGDLEDYRQNLHPTILRLIRNIVSSASFKSKEVSVCGEMASDPLSAALLVGAGVTSFSMQPVSIPAVRQCIARYTFANLQKLLQKALSLDSASEVDELVKDSLVKV